MKQRPASSHPASTLLSAIADVRTSELRFDMQNVTVTALVVNFADACRALVPMLDGASVPWRDEGQHDEWNRIAEPLFHTLVAGPCALAALGESASGRLDIARYGVEGAQGDCKAYVAVDGPEPRRLLALSTKSRPFDRVTLADAEADEKMRLTDCRFIFVFEGPEGLQQQLVEVALRG
jgi:hypothetical protein